MRSIEDQSIDRQGNHKQDVRKYEFLITAIVIAAGFVMVVAWFAQLVLQDTSAPQ